MHCQQCFQTFGLCLSQLLAPCSICCVLQSLQQYCCGCQGPGAILIQQYTLSVHALFHQVPVLCLLFYSMGFLSLRIAVLGVSSPQTHLQGFFCRVYFSKLPLQHWVGQLVFQHLGMLLYSCSSWASWAPSLHLGCGCELDIKLFIYLFIWNIQTGWLSSAFKSRFKCGPL